MKTTKAYLAGVGMAGVVIASVLVLLAVGTGVVGFDGAPELGRSKQPLDRVVADDHDALGRGGPRQVHGGWPWPAATAPRGGGFGSDLDAGERRMPTATRRERPRRRPRRAAARGFGGAESWTRARLGGGAAVGASATRERRGKAPSGGRPDMSGGAIAPVRPRDSVR